MGYHALNRLEQVVTPYNDVDVVASADGTIDFDVIGATHATWHPTRLLTGHAWDAITAGTLMHPGHPASLLLLGLGGGTVLRQIRHFLPHIHLTAIEIDPEMIRLASVYMELERLQPEVIAGDAFDFLAHDTRKYDIIIDDLYRCGEQDVERPGNVNRAYVTDLKDRLCPGGVLVMNFVLGRGHQQPHRRARDAFTQIFGSVRAVRPPLSHNEALVGTPAPDGLRAPRALKGLGACLELEADKRYWQELRNLKLR